MAFAGLKKQINKANQVRRVFIKRSFIKEQSQGKYLARLKTFFKEIFRDYTIVDGGYHKKNKLLSGFTDYKGNSMLISALYFFLYIIFFLLKVLTLFVSYTYFCFIYKPFMLLTLFVIVFVKCVTT